MKNNYAKDGIREAMQIASDVKGVAQSLRDRSLPNRSFTSNKEYDDMWLKIFDGLSKIGELLDSSR